MEGEQILFSYFLFQKFAHCLALLPKVKGDEDSWPLMMQKILITTDMLLNDAFQGLQGRGYPNFDYLIFLYFWELTFVHICGRS